MTRDKNDSIEIKRVTFELERIEAIEESHVVAPVQGNTPFHSTTYARNMLAAKVLVAPEDIVDADGNITSEPSIQYITLFGEETLLHKAEAKIVLSSIVERQDFFWAEYFNKIKALYV